ncbi:Major facilitator superfamily transporter [Cordyceps fumosorosea ARSEF 2679]|uniref:Major facilitator superfamily transporter n=1 Tax=Cordyceps fumosorosea (strain ARSEF 2679) TaxID=1081104 RepID=A0A167RMI5_CORFA|nr:Major facilitator superfamily transporter [Cordyceps fumosorosea ARSEF 2679]OAA58741.1 Major facilitator superfamily transporter [Cordyceps fumosorosea ARSEF 2679]
MSPTPDNNCQNDNANGGRPSSPELTETTPLLAAAASRSHDVPSSDPSSDPNATTSAHPHPHPHPHPHLEDGAVSSRPPPPLTTSEAIRTLPKLQILLLCFARTMEPVAFFAIFPFVAQMVQRNGRLADADVGFYSGLIESLFSVVQIFVLIVWGRVADSVGRKPVMIITLTGMMASTMAYTMATTIPQMILFRCLAGVFSGSRLVMRTMLFEHCTPENEAIAYSWFGFANNIGTTLGPLIGGVFADPVAQYPKIFKGVAFFERFPYALVGLVLTAIGIVGILVSAFFLEETLKPTDESVASSNGSKPAAPQAMSMRELLTAPKVAITIWVYTHFMLLAFAVSALTPVFLFTPVAIGGTGFSSSQISIYMAVQGASQAVWLIFAFPLLQRRFGTRSLLKLCATAYQSFFCGIVLLSVFLRCGAQSAMAWAWVIGGLLAVIGPGVSMGFTSAQLAINDASPSRQVMATMNGLSMTSASIARSFVPAVSTVIFAVGVRGQILWGYLAWAILVPLAIALRIFVDYIPGSRRISHDNK